MRQGWMAVICVVGLAAAGTIPAARAEGVSVGIHAGYADLDGELFEGAGDLEGTPFGGIHLVIPVARNLRLALSGEARSKDLTFDEAGADQALHGEAEWTDQTLRAALRLRLLPFGSGTGGVYLGGGVGVQIQEIEVKVVTRPATLAGVAVARAGVDGPRRADDPGGDFVEDLEKEETNLSVHALAGVALPLHPVPVSIFAEVRFEEIGGDGTPRSLSAYGGLSLDL